MDIESKNAANEETVRMPDPLPPVSASKTKEAWAEVQRRFDQLVQQKCNQNSTLPEDSNLNDA